MCLVGVVILAFIVGFGARVDASLDFGLHSSQTADHIAVQTLNEHIGAAILQPFNNETLSLWEDDSTCNQYRGTVVLASFPHSLTWAQTHRMAKKADDCGAIAIMFSIEAPFPATSRYLGFHYHMRDTDCCDGAEPVSINVLAVWGGDMEPVYSSLAAHPELAVSASLCCLDTNPWDEDLFSTSSFHSLSILILTVANALALVAAVAVFLMRRSVIASSPHPSGPRRSSFDSTISTFSRVWPLVVLSVEGLACAMRCGYGVMDPFFSSSRLPVGAHIAVVAVGLLGQGTIACLLGAVFRRIGRIAHHKCDLEVVVTLAVPTIFQIVLTCLLVARVSVGLWYLAALLVCVCGAGFVFALSGLRLLAQLHRSVPGNCSQRIIIRPTRSNATSRVALWVCLGAAAFGVEVVCILVALGDSALFLSPHTFGCVQLLFQAALTLSSCANINGLIPHQHMRDRSTSSQDPVANIKGTMVEGFTLAPLDQDMPTRVVPIGDEETGTVHSSRLTSQTTNPDLDEVRSELEDQFELEFGAVPWSITHTLSNTLMPRSPFRGNSSSNSMNDHGPRQPNTLDKSNTMPSRLRRISISVLSQMSSDRRSSGDPNGLEYALAQAQAEMTPPHTPLALGRNSQSRSRRFSAPMEPITEQTHTPDLQSPDGSTHTPPSPSQIRSRNPTALLPQPHSQPPGQSPAAPPLSSSPIPPIPLPCPVFVPHHPHARHTNPHIRSVKGKLSRSMSE